MQLSLSPVKNLRGERENSEKRVRANQQKEGGREKKKKRVCEKVGEPRQEIDHR